MDRLKKKMKINVQVWFLQAKTLVLTKVSVKYTKLLDKIKNLIKTTHGPETGDYGKYLMKIKFNSDDNLALNKYWSFMIWQ